MLEKDDIIIDGGNSEYVDSQVVLVFHDENVAICAVINFTTMKCIILTASMQVFARERHFVCGKWC